MHSSPHRTNSDFQLRHFIANSCHTADAAWCLMYDQRLAAQEKIIHTKARIMKQQAERIKIEEKLNSDDPYERIIGEADLMVWEHSQTLIEPMMKGAEDELATIETIMAELEPKRKYGHLSVLEATSLSQRDEWLEEFKHRCENYLISMGTIPEDQLAAMRKHPDFKEQIVPYVQQLAHRITEGQDKLQILTNKVLLLNG